MSAILITVIDHILYLVNTIIIHVCHFQYDEEIRESCHYTVLESLHNSYASSDHRFRQYDQHNFAYFKNVIL